MEEFILANESQIRLGAFFAGLILLSVWEWRIPERSLTTSKLKRWLNNIGLVITSTLLVRLITPAAAIGIAYLAQQNEWGWLHQAHYSLPTKIIVSVVVLDLVIYFQHLSFHELPLLWRFHRVHHSDRDCDVSTGLRFHPLEILLSIFVKMLAVFTLGAPVLAVIIFESILNFMSMFTHANVHFPRLLDKSLRLFIVTPNMHRIHHSALENETNSNFGFFIPWWDKIFGTYISEPEGGQKGMKLGLDQFNSDRALSFFSLLSMPVKRNIRGYAINARDASSAAELAQKNTELEIMIKNAEHSKLEAEKANQAKTVFLANMSHELMTPLNAIMGYSGFLEDEAKAHGLNEFSENLERIQNAGNNLQNIMIRLLELSKLEAEKYDAQLEDFDVNELIQEVVIVSQPLIEARSNDIVFFANQQLGTIRSDRNKLRQVILNLISNAAKFTDSGSIKIEAEFVQQQGQEFLSVSIADTGIGIETENLPSIFKAFSQADNSPSRQYGGSGLGLTIGQRFCQLLGGDITVKSEIGKGSTFTVSVPSLREKIREEHDLLLDAQVKRSGSD